MYSIPNISDLLARAIYADLCLLLPPPSDDTPEARVCRDERAMTAVAHLLPENAAEAEVAVLVVAAQSRAREALRAASQPGFDPDQTRRCTAQAACMMRQADGSIRTLLRMQAERQKAETAMRPAAMERAGYWFYSRCLYINTLGWHNWTVPGSGHGYREISGLHITSAAHPHCIDLPASLTATRFIRAAREIPRIGPVEGTVWLTHAW